MNPTKVFLLRLMASATTLEEFYLAHRAIENLERLQSIDPRVAPIPHGPPAEMYSSEQIRLMQMQRSGVSVPAQPPAANPFSRSEPSWGEGDEQMPWEG